MNTTDSAIINIKVKKALKLEAQDLADEFGALPSIQRIARTLSNEVMILTMF